MHSKFVATVLYLFANILSWNKSQNMMHFLRNFKFTLSIVNTTLQSLSLYLVPMHQITFFLDQWSVPDRQPVHR